MLQVLPPEGILAILSYLPVQALRTLRLVSRDWEVFIQTHEASVYKKAALLHGFLPSPNFTSVSDLRSTYAARSLSGLDNWKDFCHRRLSIERSWHGQGPSSIASITAAGDSVHRIKVDENAGYVITTSRHGGLVVTDLTRNEVLWSLPREYVRPYAHCEYDAGFLIFDRWNSSKEVWRRACDYDPERQPADSRPDIWQVRASELAEANGSASGHGHFKPWALLTMPTGTQAYRFVNPTLLVAGANEAYLWDIPSATLSQTIIIPEPDEDEEIHVCYVEISVRHVFICAEEVLRVFSREDERFLFDLDVGLITISCAECKFSGNSGGIHHPNAVLQPSTLEPLHEFGHRCRSQRASDKFIAVHVSACGSHLVALLLSSKLIILYDFERVLNGEIDVFDAMVDIQLGLPVYSSRYLAFENDRIAVATGYGLFVLSVQVAPDPREITQRPPPPHPSPSRLADHISISLARCFSCHISLRRITCLQMTDTQVFLNWDCSDPLVDTVNEYHTQIEDAFMADPELTDEDVIAVDMGVGTSNVVCLDLLPSII